MPSIISKIRIFYVFLDYILRAIILYPLLRLIYKIKSFFVDSSLSVSPISSCLQSLRFNGISVIDISPYFDVDSLFLDSNSNNQSPDSDKYYLRSLIGGDFLSGSSISLNKYPPISSLISTLKLNSVADQYFGCSSKLVDLQLAVTIPSSNSSRVYSQNWHKDPAQNNVLKFFLYLSDVDSLSGPFEYIRKTHNRNSLFSTIGPFNRRFFGRSFYPSSRDIDDFLNLNSDLHQTITGLSGTLIACDTTGYHRGGYSLNSPRVMLTIVYYPITDKIRSRVIQ